MCNYIVRKADIFLVFHCNIFTPTFVSFLASQLYKYTQVNTKTHKSHILANERYSNTNILKAREAKENILTQF